MEYKYYFGTYNSTIHVSNNHEPDIVGGSDILLGMWELKHVDSVSERVESTASTVGIANKPSECTYIFDTSGPVRTFTITGKRYDSEEDISNLDFIHTQFNKINITSTYDPFTGAPAEITYYYAVGIEWMTSTLQSTMKGYLFRKVASDLDSTERIPVQSISPLYNGEEYNVGVTAFSYNLDTEVPGMMTYSITLMERKVYEGGPVYREYTPAVEYSSGSE